MKKVSIFPKICQHQLRKFSIYSQVSIFTKPNELNVPDWVLVKPKYAKNMKMHFQGMCLRQIIFLYIKCTVCIGAMFDGSKASALCLICARNKHIQYSCPWDVCSHQPHYLGIRETVHVSASPCFWTSEVCCVLFCTDAHLFKVLVILFLIKSLNQSWTIFSSTTKPFKTEIKGIYALSSLSLYVIIK